jgi:putative tricarboxylic transport membrane protein
MGFWENLSMGFGLALTATNLFYAAAGVILGTAIGVLPALGPATTIALLLPITYKIQPVSAVIMLAGIFYGAMYGGSTTSILVNIPGESSSVVTCLDGHQMARQGRAGPALGIAAIGSFIAGTFGIFGLAFMAPVLSSLAIKFGPAEYFSLLVCGLLMAVYLSERSILKGLMMMALGFLLGSVGLDPVQGIERFTFGSVRLMDGINFVVVAMGLFGLSEVLMNVDTPEVREIFKTSIKGLLPSKEDWKQCWASVVRGSLLGFFIGVLPGGGAVISSFASYTLEKGVSKHPERFGKGAIEGVAGPESANNAASSSSFIPLLTLGVPGNSSTAMILVALMIHGIRPGPLLYSERPDIVWGVIASMYIGNVMLLALNLPLIGIWVKLLHIPYRFIVMGIMVICVVGAYSINYTFFDVGLMILFGMFGYVVRKNGFPPAPLVLAMILGDMFERSLNQALIGSGGSYWVFWEKPISRTLLLVAAFVVLSPLVRGFLKKRFS